MLTRGPASAGRLLPKDAPLVSWRARANHFPLVMTEKTTRPLASGIYVALLQQLLTLCWTVYVIYPPQLAAAS